MARLGPEDIVGEVHARCIDDGNSIAGGLVDCVVLDCGLVEGIEQNSLICIRVKQVVLELKRTVSHHDADRVVMNDIPVHHSQSDAVVPTVKILCVPINSVPRIIVNLVV